MVWVGGIPNKSATGVFFVVCVVFCNILHTANNPFPGG